MRRRLVLTLVGMTLVSVLLVGAGVLILARLGARGQAAAEVEERLGALAELVDGVTTGTDMGQGPPRLPMRGLSQIQSALDLRRLSWVSVDGDGTVVELFTTGGPRSGAGHRATTAAAFTLDEAQLVAFSAGETVLDTHPADDATVVRGLRRLTDVPGPAGGGQMFGLLATQEVVAVPPEATTWFVLSAGVVLAASVAVASLLARRLVRPVNRIRAATAAIAAGDLAARVEVEGNDELAGLSRSVNTMARELERSRAVDRQFLMSVSHDLRTPLTAISGYAEALRDGATDEPSRAGEIIGHHAERLERLVGDLLDLAKLEARRFTLDLRRLDTTVVVGRAVAGRAPVAARHGIELHFGSQGPAPAEIDPDRLTQVVDNIIDNALTFASASVTVAVAVTTGAPDRTPADRRDGPPTDRRDGPPTDRRDSAPGNGDRAAGGARPPSGAGGGGEVVITVVDDGPGISAEDLPHVFERLYVSAAQPVRAESPSGLGLAIVRELTAAMGGTVAATSDGGNGTTIELRFPLLDG